jgi:hypothetical protein
MLRSYLAPGAAYYAVSVSLAAAVTVDAAWRFALLTPAVIAAAAWLRPAVRVRVRSRAL